MTTGVLGAAQQLNDPATVGLVAEAARSALSELTRLDTLARGR